MIAKGAYLDWHFKALTASDYDLYFKMAADGKFLNMIFEKAKSKIFKLKGLKVDGSPDNIKSFDVPVMYYNALKTALTRAMARIKKELKEDNVIILSSNVNVAKFVREGQKWLISVEIGGVYADKR